MKPTLVLLAAGMGSRYGGLKQLDPMGPNGETLMDYSVFDALRANFGKVVFIIRKDIEEAFKKQIGSKYEKFVPVEYAFQDLNDLPGGFKAPEGRVKPWGTGHAIYAARNVVKGPFVVINADDFYGQDGYQKLADFLCSSKNNEFAMCGFKMKNTASENGSVSRGLCTTNAEGNLVDVVEHTKIVKENGKYISNLEDGSRVEIPGDAIVSMNMWGFQDTLFDYLEELFTEFLKEKGTELKSEFYIPFVVDSLVKAGRCTTKVLVSESAWFGVTYPEDKPLVQSSLQKLIGENIYPEKLFS
ncbi:MAG: nucleotidyltransferase [Lentisphaerae bacterium]|nr:nucleotidyltransferase [Lentisphaerota bacterium]